MLLHTRYSQNVVVFIVCDIFINRLRSTWKRRYRVGSNSFTIAQSHLSFWLLFKHFVHLYHLSESLVTTSASMPFSITYVAQNICGPDYITLRTLCTVPWTSEPTKKSTPRIYLFVLYYFFWLDAEKVLIPKK